MPFKTLPVNILFPRYKTQPGCFRYCQFNNRDNLDFHVWRYRVAGDYPIDGEPSESDFNLRQKTSPDLRR